MRIRVNALAGVVLLALGAVGSTGVSWSRANQAPKGLSNFGHVTDTLYRGAQPSAAGFENLQQMGVSIVVNFRLESAKTVREKHKVESMGMRYVGIPWSGRQTPSNSQVLEFLDLVRTNPQVKIFVHCERGADRTGTMIAAYRIAIEHKSVTEAVSEMYQFHYAHFWLPGLQKYVMTLPRLLQTDPRFAAFATSANPRTPIAPSVAGAPVPAAR
jgi:protein-tyrosine phosphatase